MAQFGDVAVELDALPRSVLRGLLTEEVERRMDLGTLERTRSAEQADLLRLDELLG